MKIKNKIWVSVCAFFAAICTAFGVTQIIAPTKTVAEQAAASTGLTEATLNRVEIESTTGLPSASTAVDYVKLDCLPSGACSPVWLLVDFYGQNLPNFALNATDAYSTWTSSATNATAGLGMFQSYVSKDSSGNYITVGESMVGTNGVYLESQFLLASVMAQADATYVTEREGTAYPGLTRLDESKHYVTVLGGEPTTSSFIYTWYLFEESNGALTQVGKMVVDKNAGKPTGTNVVIYPNVGVGPEEITFNYATPKTSLNDLINGLSADYEYKSQLMKALGVSAPIGDKASLKRLTLTQGASPAGEKQDYMLFDGFKDGEAVSTYFLVQHTGKNIPNFAVNATQAYDTWSTEATYATAGIGLYQSYQTYNATNGWSATWGALMGANGLLSHSQYYYGNGATNTGLLPGIGRVDDSTEYITVVGFEPGSATTTAIATYKWYLFKIADGTLELAGSQVGSANTPAAKGQYAVIYPNINNGPTEITFNYVTPKMTLDEVIMGVADDCVYKAALLEYFNISTKTLTMQDAEGNEIGTKAVLASENYTLPTSNIANFVGWEYNEGLYAAGDIIESAENITVQAICLETDVLDGASARLKIDDDGNGGLRFTVKAKTADLTALGTNVEMHGVMIPTDMIEGEFDLNETGAKDIVLSNSVALSDGYTYYYITLTDVIYSNYNREFSARAYAKVTYADEETANVAATAYDVANNSRSIYDVAVDSYNDGEEADGVLAQYIGYTVNLTYSVNASDEYVFSVVDTEDGLTDAASIRKYSIESQSATTSEGVTGVTITIKLTDLPTTLSLEKVPVTVWAEGASKGERVAVTVQSTDAAQGTVTCFFQLA